VWSDYKNGLLYHYYRKNVSRGTSKIVPRSSIEVLWTLREHYKWDAGDWDKTVNSLPPTNGWANRESKPRVRTVPLYVHQS